MHFILCLNNKYRFRNARIEIDLVKYMAILEPKKKIEQYVEISVFRCNHSVKNAIRNDYNEWYIKNTMQLCDIAYVFDEAGSFNHSIEFRIWFFFFSAFKPKCGLCDKIC